VGESLKQNKTHIPISITNSKTTKLTASVVKWSLCDSWHSSHKYL